MRGTTNVHAGLDRPHAGRASPADRCARADRTDEKSATRTWVLARRHSAERPDDYSIAGAGTRVDQPSRQQLGYTTAARLTPRLARQQQSRLRQSRRPARRRQGARLDQPRIGRDELPPGWDPRAHVSTVARVAKLPPAPPACKNIEPRFDRGSIQLEGSGIRVDGCPSSSRGAGWNSARTA